MAISALTPPQDSSTPAELQLEFPDNRLLIDLCGEHDRHLVLIEQVLGVQIVRRGNLLSVLGEDGARDRAAEVLEALYERLQSGRPVEGADVDRELRMGRGEEAKDTPAEDQLEM
ncbi:MAG TPA: phosphate starvation-inducible protein PhoH, partial [Ruegeria sp.]|nr:phosphate starvation-inducible protein PhoH [Ruegeria sp.]